MGVATGGYHRWQPFFCAYLCIENLPSEEVMKFSAGGSFSMLFEALPRKPLALFDILLQEDKFVSPSVFFITLFWLVVNTDKRRSADCRTLPCRDDTAVFSYTYTYTYTHVCVHF